MRNLILTLILALAIIFVQAQVRDLQVVAAAGGFFESASRNISLSWTMGETVVSTFSNAGANVMLTQGFQQGTTRGTGLPERLSTPFSARVFPNPVKTEAQLTISNAEQGRYTVKLVDLTGRAVITEEVEISGSEHTHTINVSSLHAGIYLVTITSGQRNSVVIRLVKE